MSNLNVREKFCALALVETLFLSPMLAGCSYEVGDSNIEVVYDVIDSQGEGIKILHKKNKDI